MPQPKKAQRAHYRIPFEEWCRRLNVVPASAVAERSEAKSPND